MECCISVIEPFSLIFVFTFLTGRNSQICPNWDLKWLVDFSPKLVFHRNQKLLSRRKPIRDIYAGRRRPRGEKYRKKEREKERERERETNVDRKERNADATTTEMAESVRWRKRMPREARGRVKEKQRKQGSEGEEMKKWFGGPSIFPWAKKEKKDKPRNIAK